jgi:hypothetical protein
MKLAAGNLLDPLGKKKSSAVESVLLCWQNTFEMMKVIGAIPADYFSCDGSVSTMLAIRQGETWNFVAVRLKGASFLKAMLNNLRSMYAGVN